MQFARIFDIFGDALFLPLWKSVAITLAVDSDSNQGDAITSVSRMSEVKIISLLDSSDYAGAEQL